MNHALFAVDPTNFRGRRAENVYEMLRYFQRHNLFAHLDVASVIHRNLYLLPFSDFAKGRSRLLKEAHRSLDAYLEDRFRFRTIRVVISDFTSPEDHVETLTRMMRRIKAKWLIVGASGRKGLAYWMVGSFSEAAVQTAKVPVLVLKSRTDRSKLSKTPKILFVVDAISPPSTKSVIEVEELAESLRATVHLLYVFPSPRLMRRMDGDLDRKALAALKAIHKRFESRGIKNKVIFKNEVRTVAHTVIRYAEEIKPWLLVVSSVERGRRKRILPDSTVRRTLALSNYPFLLLRNL